MVPNGSHYYWFPFPLLDILRVHTTQGNLLQNLKCTMHACKKRKVKREHSKFRIWIGNSQVISALKGEMSKLAEINKEYGVETNGKSNQNYPKIYKLSIHCNHNHYSLGFCFYEGDCFWSSSRLSRIFCKDCLVLLS